ncbi:hypothetical protein C3L50_05900 [Flavobacterium alvei]|uniref:pEK499-p136 HEPN domain-containing protein n=1 Tax=Flavobacterium alvei TaxID=2080416 RepID=A0A2S5ACY9_9FLAO|nr:hypothetical protein [Flavobacterium alvei]POY40179.1 hypothetical protein C3L50_05900 [Flavobacterium alvei]
MYKDRETNFQEHSIFLSEIAKSILEGDLKILSIPGVSEIIALYLLIPYITNDQLDTGMHLKIPQLDLNEEFINGVNLQNLRNALSHSFVSVEESTEKGIGRIIIDDRSQMNRKNHDEQESKTKGVFIDIIKANEKLQELHNKVINTIP